MVQVTHTAKENRVAYIKREFTVYNTKVNIDFLAKQYEWTRYTVHYPVDYFRAPLAGLYWNSKKDVL